MRHDFLVLSIEDLMLVTAVQLYAWIDFFKCLLGTISDSFSSYFGVVIKAMFDLKCFQLFNYVYVHK